MISLMERYVLDFGRDSAKLAALERNACDAGDKQEQQRIEIEGVANLRGGNSQSALGRD
jgi:hypothetical protein